MLTESFVVSIETPEKPSANPVHRDAGIFFHEYQPQPALKSTLKKSSTRPNCLALSSTHVFAAQTDKAVVSVYNIVKGSQESLFPFKEKITSLALVGETEDAGILALGNEAGRVLLCELLTGRQVSTPAAHLQAIKCMVVDTTKNFLLTGSLDSNIHVWSIPSLLSFTSSSNSYDPSSVSPYSPVHTLSNHRAAITGLVTGHSHSKTNIAVSASRDNTCVVWDYHEGVHLHTFLLPSTPLCITLDPADRALYAGYENGSVQFIDFFKQSRTENAIYDSKLSSTPTQPPNSDRWPAVSEHSPILSLGLSYDGTSLLTGHENGNVQQWDVSAGKSRGVVVAEFHAPVTNILMQRPQGFLQTTSAASKPLLVVKPVLELSDSASASRMPQDYSLKAQFTRALPINRFSGLRRPGGDVDLMQEFDEALTHTSLPAGLIEEGVNALSIPSSSRGDIAALQGWQTDPRRDVVEAQQATTDARKETFKYIDMLNNLSKEVVRMQNAERARRRNKKLKRVRREKYEEEQRKKAVGEGTDADEVMADEAGGLSTSTDEMTGSE